VNLPAWAVVGARVDYSSVIGRPPTILGATIIEPPFELPKLAGYPDRWACMIDKKRGWVALDALQPSQEPAGG
jgi:hypothetical protein